MAGPGLPSRVLPTLVGGYRYPAAAIGGGSEKITLASAGRNIRLYAGVTFCPYLIIDQKGRYRMKRALIAIASVGILAPAAWMMDANAQQMNPASPPSQAYAPSQMAPTQAYAQQQRRYRRSARYTQPKRQLRAAPAPLFAAPDRSAPRVSNRPCVPNCPCAST